MTKPTKRPVGRPPSGRVKLKTTVLPETAKVIEKRAKDFSGHRGFALDQLLK